MGYLGRLYERSSGVERRSATIWPLESTIGRISVRLLSAIGLMDTLGEGVIDSEGGESVNVIICFPKRLNKP